MKREGPYNEKKIELLGGEGVRSSFKTFPAFFSPTFFHLCSILSRMGILGLWAIALYAMVAGPILP